jgi:hypothetical protein
MQNFLITELLMEQLKDEFQRTVFDEAAGWSEIQHMPTKICWLKKPNKPNGGKIK